MRLKMLKHSAKKVLGALKIAKKKGKDEVESTKLHEKSNISGPVFAEAKKKLQSEDLINVRKGEEDKRKKYCSLTEKGEARSSLEHILEVSDKIVLNSEELFKELEEINRYVIEDLPEDSGPIIKDKDLTGKPENKFPARIRFKS